MCLSECYKNQIIKFVNFLETKNADFPFFIKDANFKLYALLVLNNFYSLRPPNGYLQQSLLKNVRIVILNIRLQQVKVKKPDYFLDALRRLLVPDCSEVNQTLHGQPHNIYNSQWLRKR